MDPVVIVNPRSGKGLDERSWARLVGPLTEGLGPFATRFTERRGHARDIACEEAEAGRPLVVAFGGDGTISEVVDGLMAAGVREGGSPATEMGIIPRGTGGDFRRTLDLPNDIAAAAERIRCGPARSIDVGRATLAGPGSGGQPLTRHFVNVASFGFSSTVAEKANQSSKRLGAKFSFLSATVRSLASYDNADVFLSIDGGERQRRTLLLGAVGNGRFFGGGMKICPEALLDDGRLDLVCVGDLGGMEILAKMPRLYAGTHLTMKEVRAARITTLEVSSADPRVRIPVELDGETPGYLPAKFEVVPGALHLRF